MIRKHSHTLTAGVILAGLLFPFQVFIASAGNIDSGNGYAWSENLGWFNLASTEGDVTVTDTALTGYIWTENAGWVSLNCSNTSSCATVDYKVANNGSGTLSGYAWGENVGWINFSPTFGGVSINGSGVFSGYAWGENVGWASFNCANTSSCATVDYKVATIWRPASGTTPTATPTPPAAPPAATLPSITPSGVPTLTPMETANPSSTPNSSITPNPSSIPTSSPNLTPGPPSKPPSETPPPPIGNGTPSSSPTPQNPPGPPQIGNSFANTLKTAAKSIKIASPIASSLVVLSTAVSVLSLAGSGVGFLDYLAYIGRALLVLLGIKKRARPWGTVYNSATKQPLPFSRVNLINREARVIETQVTDQLGRYGFLINPDSVTDNPFRLVVSKTNFIFPSQRIVTPYDAQLYRNIYTGGDITLQPNNLVNFDIPVDPLDTPVVTLGKIPHMFIHNLGVRIADIAFWASLVLIPVNYIIARNLFNLVMLILLCGIIVLRILGDLREKPYGVVRNISTAAPLAYALITLQDATGQRRGMAVSDDAGRYILLSDKGTFDISLATPADIQPPRIKKESVTTPRGWIARMFDL
ncbi:MAG: hypothetical protein A3A33_01005 [Candidatus Yanofskybacteria bacterium RIFCSPLOWO2_01_FULL_49_25]|uniref:Uncharacterized protein n=1 Tax=Candidatus Yanofskybacteria bacterium RIFCSPLOWO2_01_FULL_49_25 TaxID=1802701 RepID=A0A1F8GXY5_9BACT|nr:MAG: hypothetical protein A3A33_01005 [Candidatus Yanofskybacteria bacterium RIFCSPLOWO2_01_FULL_49_25]